MAMPASTGPIMLDSAGARPSQLNTRVICVLSPAASRPALRWMVISPMLAPTPHNMAATLRLAKAHHSGSERSASSAAQPLWGAADVSHTDAPASSPPLAVSATARCIGRW